MGELWFVKECVQSPGTKTVGTTSCSGCTFSISVRLTRMRQYLCYLNHNVTKSNITSQEQQLLKVKRVAMQQNKSRSSDVRRNVCFIVNLTVFVSENENFDTNWSFLLIKKHSYKFDLFHRIYSSFSYVLCDCSYCFIHHLLFSQLSRPEHTFFSFIIAQLHLLSPLPLSERPSVVSFSVFEKLIVCQGLCGPEEVSGRTCFYQVVAQRLPGFIVFVYLCNLFTWYSKAASLYFHVPGVISVFSVHRVNVHHSLSLFWMQLLHTWRSTGVWEKTSD